MWLCLLLALGGVIQAKEITLPDLGTLRGTTTLSSWTNRTIFQYHGVPYAEPPVGTLRFKRPEIYKGKWTKIFEANEFGPVCPQDGGVPVEKGRQDEDCLHINIYTPDTEGGGEGRGMPVMVYLHGGSFRVGSARNILPNYLLEEDVVLAVPQYRLGPLGFLSLKTDDVPGNQGMLDVLLALEWVNKNIQHFGGDPTRVTVFGQSAGGVAVNLLLFSPLLKDGLIQRGIVQGASGISMAILDTEPVAHARMIAANANCTQSDLDELAACLRVNTTVKQLLKAHTQFRKKNSGGNQVVWNEAGPQSFLLNDPQVLLQEGNYKHLPLMGGVTKHECSFCVADLYDIVVAKNLTTSQDFLSRDMTRLTLEYSGIDDGTGLVADTMREKYFTDEDFKDFNKMVPGLIDIAGCAGIKAPVFTVINEMSRTTPSYLYSFNFFGRFSSYGYFSTYGLGPENWKYPFPPGVAHADELLYIFPQEYAPLNEEETAVAKKMVQFWTSFATTGTPAAKGVPAWPKVSTAKGPYMRIDGRPTVRANFIDEFTAAVREGLTPLPSSSPVAAPAAMAPVLMLLARQL